MRNILNLILFVSMAVLSTIEIERATQRNNPTCSPAGSYVMIDDANLNDLVVCQIVDEADGGKTWKAEYCRIPKGKSLDNLVNAFLNKMEKQEAK